MGRSVSGEKKNMKGRRKVIRKVGGGYFFFVTELITLCEAIPVDTHIERLFRAAVQ
jgi:hypothetical protein